MTRRVTLRCEACGHEAESLRERPLPFACPRARVDTADHVLAPELDAGSLEWPRGAQPSPFERYRELLFAHEAALELGLGDEGYLEAVRALDAEVERVDGKGFRASRTSIARGLDDDASTELLVKDETGNVAGSHKARHLFGIAIYLDVLRRAGLERHAQRLSIASCGNAALAAAVVAQAAGRPLDVHVPTEASASVLERLRRLGAVIHVHARGAGEVGEPTVTAFRAEVREGAVPFGCQGTENGLTLDGGRTLGFEIADSLRELGAVDRIFVQVGGGALASSLARGLHEAHRLGALERVPRIHPVQTQRVAPLAAAYERFVGLASARGAGRTLPPCGDERADTLRSAAWSVAVAAALDEGRQQRSKLLVPWPEPRPSLAYGLLDDETYDGLAVLRHTVASGGTPVVVDEATLAEAAERMRSGAGIDACVTGAAGLAGWLAWKRAHPASSPERVLVIATGVRRG